MNLELMEYTIRKSHFFVYNYTFCIQLHVKKKRFPGYFVFFLDIAWLVMTLAMLGKLSISCSFMILFVFEAELLPTEVRLKGVAALSLSENLGSAISPYITDYLVSGPLLCLVTGPVRDVTGGPGVAYGLRATTTPISLVSTRFVMFSSHSNSV